MVKHHTHARGPLMVTLSIIGGTGLFIWGLVALGFSKTATTNDQPSEVGTAIYLTASPSVTTELVTPGKRTVVWFSATWCQICKTMSPYVQKVVERHADQVVITERDIDREPALARQYAVRGTPTFVLLDQDGETMTTRVGHMSERQFESFITQSL